MVYWAAIRLRGSGLPLHRVRPRRAAFSGDTLDLALDRLRRLALNQDDGPAILVIGRHGRPAFHSALLGACPSRLKPLGPDREERPSRRVTQRQGVSADAHHEVGASLPHVMQPLAHWRSCGRPTRYRPPLTFTPSQVLALASCRQLASQLVRPAAWIVAACSRQSARSLPRSEIVVPSTSRIARPPLTQPTGGAEALTENSPTMMTSGIGTIQRSKAERHNRPAFDSR